MSARSSSGGARAARGARFAVPAPVPASSKKVFAHPERIVLASDPLVPLVKLARRRLAAGEALTELQIAKLAEAGIDAAELARDVAAGTAPAATAAPSIYAELAPAAAPAPSRAKAAVAHKAPTAGSARAPRATAAAAGAGDAKPPRKSSASRAVAAAAAAAAADGGRRTRSKSGDGGDALALH